MLISAADKQLQRGSFSAVSGRSSQATAVNTSLLAGTATLPVRAFTFPLLPLPTGYLSAGIALLLRQKLLNLRTTHLQEPGVSVGVGVFVGVSVRVAVGVQVAVSVDVGVSVDVSVGVSVAVLVGAGVKVKVAVGVLVNVGVNEGVAVTTT